MDYEQIKKELISLKEIPYPQTINVCKDVPFANRLYNDYAGTNGELSAIMLYTYQHFAIEDKKQILLNKIMLQIAEVEMRHLNILGNLIKKLGMNPYYMNSYGKEWSANNIYYQSKDIVTIMEYNIRAEQIAIQGYTKDKEYTDNKSIKELFDRIILDEKSHIRIFCEILEEYKR